MVNKNDNPLENQIKEFERVLNSEIPPFNQLKTNIDGLSQELIDVTNALAEAGVLESTIAKKYHEIKSEKERISSIYKALKNKEVTLRDILKRLF